MTEQSVTPECKYGHGPIEPQNANSDSGYWSLHSAGLNGALGRRIFIVKVFKCKTCGYIELFDPEPEA